jgi:hypothetical protein
VEFRAKHVSIRVLDRDTVEITKNGTMLEDSDEDVTVEKRFTAADKDPGD